MDENAQESRNMPLPLVSVIIPVHNGAATLGAVLDALARQTYPADRFEVIVADNRSTDDTVALARAKGARVVFETERQSAYAARNRGIAEARGEILAFLDGDCRPADDWLSEGVAALSREGADLAGGRIDVSAEAGGSSLLARYETLSYVRQEHTIRERGMSAGGNLFIRRCVIERIGPFRETLVSGGDGEICLRARQAGFRIVYAERARVTHRAQATVWGLMKRYYRLGRGEADLDRMGVDQGRAAGGGLIARRGQYIRRVWQAEGLSPWTRVAILLINFAAGIAQELGHSRQRPSPLLFVPVLLVLALSALLVRWHAPAPQVYYPDGAYYMRQAQAYLEGQGSIAPPWRWLPAGGPVYPALTALLTPLTGDLENAGLWVSRLAGVGLVLVVAWLGFRMGGVIAGAVAGVLTLVEPRLVHFSESALTESLFMALWFWAMVVGWRMVSGRTAWWEEVGLGILTGALVLTRAVGGIALGALGIALLAAFAARPQRGRIALGTLRVMGAATLIVLAYQGYAWQHGWHTAMDRSPDAVTHLFEPAATPPGSAHGSGTPTEQAPPAISWFEILKGQAKTGWEMFPPLVWGLALAGLVSRLARARRGLVADLYLLLWLGCYLFVLILFGSALPRYLMVAAPLVFVYAGFGVAAAAEGVAWVGRRSGWAALVAGAGGGLLLAVAVLAAIQTRGLFTLPPSPYPTVRGWAEGLRAGMRPQAPLRVYADHAFLPYYLHGYWLGLPNDATGAADGGSRIVVLDAAYANRLAGPWRERVFGGVGDEVFHPLAQRYFPNQYRLLTVYADTPAAPEAVPGGAARLLQDGDLLNARRLLLAEADPAQRLTGLGTVEMVLGQYSPEHQALARRMLDEAIGSPFTADGAPPSRVPWRSPPGEIYLDTGHLAALWNRAAVALSMGDTPAAWESVQALEPLVRDARYAYLRGLVMFRMGGIRESALPLDTALRAFPDEPGVMVARADQFTATAQYGAAVPLYQRALGREPDNAGIWLNLIQACLAGGDFGRAERAIVEAGHLPLDAAQAERLNTLAAWFAQRQGP